MHISYVQTKRAMFHQYDVIKYVDFIANEDIFIHCDNCTSEVQYILVHISFFIFIDTSF